jgi:hypothetical protein
MKKTPLLSIVVFVIGFTAGVLVWQQVAVKRLATENVALQGQLKDAIAAADATAASSRERIDDDELKRLREGQAELLRLRGQVLGLRRDAEAARVLATKALARAGTNAAPTVETNISPVDSFTAHATATVGWKQVLVTGGWETSSGKRGFVLVQPSDEVGDNQVHLTTHVIEVPEALLVTLGNSVRAEDKDSTSKNVLSADAAREFLQKLKETDGVDLLTTPQVITLNGRQAQVSVREAHTAYTGETYYTGPTIDIVPTIGADGKSVEMVVGVELNLKRPTTP